MDWKKPTLIKNVSGGRLVNGAFALANGEEKEINPVLYSDKAMKKFQLYYAQELIEATNDFTPQKDSGETLSVKEVSTTKNADGEQRKHVVFDPNAERAIKTISIDTDKAVKVENLLDEGKAVEVAYSEVDRIEAKDFLNQHWKRVESEIAKVTSVRKLEFYLEMAIEYAIAQKKIDIIKDRLGQLNK